MIKRVEITQDIQDLLCNAIVPCETFQTQANPAASCSKLPSRCSSGYYWVRNSNGTVVQVYCDVTRQCCGGHALLTSIWPMLPTNAPRHGGKSHHPGGCVGGRLLQQVVAVAWHISVPTTSPTLIFVVDWLGISLVTRVHFVVVLLPPWTSTMSTVWASHTALHDSTSGRLPLPLGRQTGSATCRCTNTANTNFINVPSYVSQDYFCETGTPVFTNLPGIFYSNDPLWDGQGCGATITCCQFNTPPWFCKQLPQATTVNIEVRICAGHGYSDIDTPVELVEIYIHWLYYCIPAYTNVMFWRSHLVSLILSVCLIPMPHPSCFQATGV